MAKDCSSLFFIILKRYFRNYAKNLILILLLAFSIF